MDRLTEMRQKREQERRKRQGMLLKILIAAAAIVLLIIILLAVRGCGQDKEQQPKPTPLQTQTTSQSGASNTYFDNTVFIGGAFVNGLKELGLTGGAEYFTADGLSVDKATREALESGKTAAQSLDTSEQYDKIFMSFGETELEWSNPSVFINQYSLLIGKAVKYQPQSTIYLLAIPPVTAEISESDENNITNERIQRYNELIAALAAEKGAVYADIYAAVADGDGNLPDTASEDGIHLTGEYYEQCVSYIQTSYE